MKTFIQNQIIVNNFTKVFSPHDFKKNYKVVLNLCIALNKFVPNQRNLSTTQTHFFSSFSLCSFAAVIRMHVEVTADIINLVFLASDGILKMFLKPMGNKRKKDK